MQRAKHRASGSDATVPVTALLERYAGSSAASSGSCHGVATLPPPVAVDRTVDAVGGALPSTGAMPVIDDMIHDTGSDAALWDAVALFEAAARGAADAPSFGAARHARSRGRGPTPGVPAPRISGTSPSLPAVSQPISAGIAATVLGAAAAVTAVVVPVPTAPSAVETTLRMAPVQEASPVLPLAPGLAAAAPLAPPDQPTVLIPDLVSGVRAQMQKAAPTASTPTASTSYRTVANTTALSSSPAAMMRRAAMTTALGRIGKPYRWGAMGPNAFDCSGLVKWSFANVGRNLPRTSRAMASVGTPVARRDLQPGDLVFFYQPISHVGIYIGNNKIVHASQTGQPVKVSDITYMRFTTARRIV